MALRGNPGISEALYSLLASYEGRAHSEVAQGKPNSVKRSGRYNAHDSVTAAPHLRWPNEGFNASNGKKGSCMTICPYPSELLATEQHLRNFRSDIIQASIISGHTRDEGRCLIPMACCKGHMGFIHAPDRGR